MALNKTITETNGIQTNYHKISNIRVNAKTGDKFDLTIFVASYVNEEYRQDGVNNAVVNNAYFATATIEEMEATPIFTLAYAKLKNMPAFAGATDI